jgi:hypothetical protein
MKAHTIRFLTFLFLMLLFFASLGWGQDSLYISDSFTNQVQRFDASTGAYQGVFVSYSGLSSAPVCPTGLVFNHLEHSLLVNFQNCNTQFPGEVDRFNDQTGNPEGALIPASNPNAPPAPVGILLFNQSAFVASGSGISEGTPGEIQPFGATLGNLPTSAAFVPNFSNSTFHPIGEVIGPDRLLYVTNDSGQTSNSEGVGGQILVFNPTTKAFVKIFADSNTCGCDMNSPIGLAFGPDGNLYVTSLGSFNAFTTSINDTDKILVFAGPLHSNRGTYLDHIDLDQVGGSKQEYAAFLLFGPKGKLFVPIFTTGEVRSYDVSTKTFSSFVPAPTHLVNPFGLTFGRTNPVTLAYCEYAGCDTPWIFASTSEGHEITRSSWMDSRVRSLPSLLSF